ncbi:MFS transporter [Actinacidiphila sp. bgisy144]|uniref:MFS transporter n=1 Tax=Actinacidiphila sp. bgisy144 TaxID=3413791 RepID=UPI003EBE5B60
MIGTAHAAPPPATVSAHRDPNVLRWLAAYTASLLGDSVYFLALGFAAAKVAPPAEVGVVMAVGAVPRALLLLGGGVVADRFGPRLVVIGSDAVRCVLILAAAAVLALTAPGLWLLIALALVFGVVDALFLPAVGALPPRLVTGDQLVRLQGMRALAVRTGNIAGPPLGGLAMGLGGASTAFAVAGGLFALSVPLLLGTRIGASAHRDDPAAGLAARARPDGLAEPGELAEPAAPTAPTELAAPDGPAGPDGLAAPAELADRGTAWAELRDGLRYVRRHRLVGPLVLSGAVSEFGLAGPLNIGMVLLARQRGWGSAGYGWIIAAFGAGAAASALLLTVRGRVRRAGVVQVATLFAGSAAIGLIGAAPVLGAAVVLALLAGLICGICGGLAVAMIQTATDPAYLGRVTSVMSLTGFGIAPLVYPAFGAAVSLWGPTPVFLAAAAVSMLGGVIALSSPAVRTAD